MDHSYAFVPGTNLMIHEQGSSTDDHDVDGGNTTGKDIDNSSQTFSHVQKNVVVVAGEKLGNSRSLESNGDSVRLASVRPLDTELMNVPAQRQRTGKEKMVLLQKQLLEIQRKQTQCLLKLKQESKKVQKLERDPKRNKINRDIPSLTKEQIVAGANQFMAEPALSFFTDQLDFAESEGEERGKVWSLETRRFALELYHLSAPAYHFMENVFHLPNISMIQSWAKASTAFD